MADLGQTPGLFTSPWTYGRDGSGLECGLFAGHQPATLGRHFHDEDQWTIVLVGRRLFEVGSRVVAVEAGQRLRIPAGTPHRGLRQPDAPMRCLNLYVPPTGREDPGAPRPSVAAALTRGDAVSAIATRLGVSREGFGRRFARTIGMSPHAWRLIARLNEARDALRGGAAVADIAADLGFADQSHLGRQFKRAFGISPAAYRRAVRAVTNDPDRRAPAG